MGYVARGGIRWSDRREDFRTEVLGLMKAQNVKNTVIVPVGAKGGFFPKRLPAGSREERPDRRHRVLPDIHSRAARRHGQHRQRAHCAAARAWSGATGTTLISSSRRTRARLGSPTSPTRSPSNTDSGSAMRSPQAAPPATTIRRWGSPRAARWECVKRHFREIGIDIQSQDFTAQRHRRHVGRRVRQRHAAVAAYAAAGGVQPSAHLSRPGA